MIISMEQTKKEEGGAILGVAKDDKSGQVIEFRLEDGALSTSSKEVGTVVGLIESLLMGTCKEIIFNGVTYYRLTDVRALMTLTA